MQTNIVNCVSKLYNLRLKTFIYPSNILCRHPSNCFTVNKCRSLLTSSTSKWFTSSASAKEESKEVNFSIVTYEGEKIDVTGKVEQSVMAIASKYELMEGACEGSLACTTCHVYIDEKTEGIVPKPSDKEDDLLDSAPYLKENSRLSCQIKLTKELEGVTFNLPKGTVHMNVDS